MLIRELIENLRRFPWNAQVFGADNILVEAAPHKDANGNTEFNACCDDDDLPETLIKAFENDWFD